MRPKCPKCQKVMVKTTYWYCPQCGITYNPTSLYRSFHGANPKNVRKVSLKLPKKGEKLVKIGRLVEVVYIPESPSKRKGTAYQHSFGDTGESMMLPDKPILAVSADGKQLFILNDKSHPKFGGRGIVG